MEIITFSITVNASAAHAYKTMLGIEEKQTWIAWTKVFNPKTYYLGEWDEGSKIRFIGQNEDGTMGGLIADIGENRPNEFVSIKPYGILEGDKIIEDGPHAALWHDSYENYLFEESEGRTTITITMKIAPLYVDYFNKTYPEGLEKLKQVIEEGLT